MNDLLLSARWPGLVTFALGGVLLLWRLLDPQLEPRHLLRWGRGRVEKALLPMVGPHAAPEVAGQALLIGGLGFLLGGGLLGLLLGPIGIAAGLLLAWAVAWTVANRRVAQRNERLSEQVQGLVQALAAGLTGREAPGGTMALLRRTYRQTSDPLREELGFMELVLRGQADLGQALSRAAGEAVHPHLRLLLEILDLIYREALDLPAQRRAVRSLLERIRQEEQIRRTVRIESRFGQTSQRIVLLLIPGFVLLAALAGSAMEIQISVMDFYLHTLPGQLILGLVVLVEAVVMWVSRRFMQRIRWD